jgi:MacB-like periplasmic core domain/FtsX-like permease family
VPEWKQEIRGRLTGLKLAPAREAEIVEELAQHLEDHYAELLTSGVMPEEAYRAALEQVREGGMLQRELRRVERLVIPEPIVLGTTRRNNMIADLWQDLRFGARMLMKQKAIAAIAVLSLGMGIGANTALFSIMDAMLLKMLPVKEPERLVIFRAMASSEFNPGDYHGGGGIDAVTGQRSLTSFPYLSFQRMREQRSAQGALSDVFAFGGVSLNVSAGGQADVAGGQAVSGNYYKGLGVQPLLGRTITDDDDKIAASPVAVLSYRYWRQRFSGDPAIIGRQINLNNVAFTVIGVTQPGFEGAMQVGSTQDVTIPIAWEPQMERLFAKLLTLFGVLAQQLAVIGLFGVMAYSVSQRTREIGIRMALGANRGDVLRMIVRQGMMLAWLGIVLGLTGAYLLAEYLEGWINLSRMLYGVRLSDPLTYGVITVLMMLAALAACFIPARRATRVDPIVALRVE